MDLPWNCWIYFNNRILDFLPLSIHTISLYTEIDDGLVTVAEGLYSCNNLDKINGEDKGEENLWTYKTIP